MLIEFNVIFNKFSVAMDIILDNDVCIASGNVRIPQPYKFVGKRVKDSISGHKRDHLSSKSNQSHT